MIAGKVKEKSSKTTLRKKNVYLSNNNNNNKKKNYAHGCAPPNQSSPIGISSFNILFNLTLISVCESPLRISDTNQTSQSNCTISSDPFRTPHKILEYQSDFIASMGNSTKSAKGFSSKINENESLLCDQFVILGVMFRKILNAHLLSTSLVFIRVSQRGNAVLAKKSSMSLHPMLYPMLYRCSFTLLKSRS